MLCSDGQETDSARHGPEALPLLPSPQASEEEWAQHFPLRELPPLPKRDSAFYSEPLCGICVVGFLSTLLVAMTSGAASVADNKAVAKVTVVLIWTWAGTATFCVLYLLFGCNGEIKRSRHNCYPVPEEVARRLKACPSEPPELKRNIAGEDGRTYCVRCLLWRPHENDTGTGHHCNTCQRCVTGFDHHCGVFGRCITDDNMPCFYTLIAMMITGVLTAGTAISLEPADMVVQ